METLASFLAAIMTIPVFVPFVSFIAVYFTLVLWKKKNNREALTIAANVTTFFLLASIMIMHGLIKDSESISAIWWIILFFVLTGGTIAWLQYKVKGKMDMPKIMRAVWRIAFVFFTIVYFFLFFSSIHYFLQLT